MLMLYGTVLSKARPVWGGQGVRGWGEGKGCALLELLFFPVPIPILLTDSKLFKGNNLQLLNVQYIGIAWHST